jgi:hypothetical protein
MRLQSQNWVLVSSVPSINRGRGVEIIWVEVMTAASGKENLLSEFEGDNN